MEVKMIEQILGGGINILSPSAGGCWCGCACCCDGVYFMAQDYHDGVGDGARAAGKEIQYP
jgi:hypothetical protein